MSIVVVHGIAVGMTFLLIFFLLYVNVKQIKEYQNMRVDLDGKIEELTCRGKRLNNNGKKTSPAGVQSIVKEVVNECVQIMACEVHDYLEKYGSSCERECAITMRFQIDDSNSDILLKKLDECKRNCSESSSSSDISDDVKTLHRFSYRNINYADSQLGAKIMNTIAEPYDCDNVWSCAVRKNFGNNPPENLLTPNMEPGCCFAFRGQTASVVIKLAKQIRIDAIGISHIDQCRSPSREISSAPKDFTVYALDQEDGDAIFLGDFTYNQNSADEVFTIKGKGIVAHYIKIDFKTNHGHPDYTCVYKLSVFGRSQ